MPRYCYTVTVHPDCETSLRSFSAAVRRILGAPVGSGWASASRSFWFMGSRRPRIADWGGDLRRDDVYLHVMLVPRHAMHHLFPQFAQNDLSVCDMGTRVCFIHEDRWRHGSTAFDAPLSEYQRYVINHEVGHAMGCPHLHLSRLCRKGSAAAESGGPCPVMVQQTRFVGCFRPNGIPTARDVALLPRSAR